MKQIDVQDQVRLGLAKSFELCISGVKYRLFRSLVTVATVALAVAFLMTMLSQSVIRRNVWTAVARETAPRRTYLNWLSHLSLPMEEARLSATLWEDPDDAPADHLADAPRLRELRTWGQLSTDELQRLRAVALREKRYLDYYARLDEGNRARLLGADTASGMEIYTEGAAIFGRLASDPAALAGFRDHLKDVNPRMPEDLEQGLDAFLAERRETAPLRDRVREGHAAAVAGVREELGVEGPTTALAASAPGLADRLGRSGYEVTPESLEALAAEARRELAANTMLEMLRITPVRSELSTRTRVPVSQISPRVLFEQARDVEDARELLNIATKTRPDLGQRLTAESMAATADAWLRQARLSEVESKLGGEAAGGEQQGFMGFSRRALWLMIVSFGVCAVGIANAMLMSVTERFREIATMKCLGAMDGFIMLLFVLESCLQGLAGGIFGALVGFLLGLGRAGWEFGGLAFADLPLASLSAAAGISLVAGIVLAALAAVYPAWVASRLAPMEAMRVE